MHVQRELIPNDLPKPRQINVPLDDLPPDSQILGTPNAAFMETLKLCQLQEIVLIETGRGGYKIAAGRRRIKGMRAVGKTHIRALVFPPQSNLVQVFALIENEHRSDNLASDFEAVEKLLGKYSEDEIIASTGINRNRLRRIMAFSTLLPDLQDALRKGKLSNTAAVTAARLDKPHQRKCLRHINEHGKLRGSDVHAISTAAHREAQIELGSDLVTPVPGEKGESFWTIITQLAGRPPRVVGPFDSKEARETNLDPEETAGGTTLLLTLKDGYIQAE